MHYVGCFPAFRTHCWTPQICNTACLSLVLLNCWIYGGKVGSPPSELKQNLSVVWSECSASCPADCQVRKLLGQEFCWTVLLFPRGWQKGVENRTSVQPWGPGCGLLAWILPLPAGNWRNKLTAGSRWAGTRVTLSQVAQGCVQVWITPTQESSQPLWVIQHPGEEHSFLVPNWDVSLCCSLCPLPCVLSLCGSGMNLDSVSFITPSRQLKAAGGTPQSSPCFFFQYWASPTPLTPSHMHLHEYICT